MKRKIVSALLCVSMIAVMLTGCGGGSSSSSEGGDTEQSEESGDGDSSVGARGEGAAGECGSPLLLGLCRSVKQVGTGVPRRKGVRDTAPSG